MVDTADSKSASARSGGSSPSWGTKINKFMMTNRCYRNLEIPAEFKPWDFGTFDKHVELPIEPNMVNKEIHDFFNSLNLDVLGGRYFYCMPNQTYNLHVDNISITGWTRINWIYGGEGSEMIWYDLKPGKSPTVYKNTLGVDVHGYDINDCDEICRSSLSSVALVNVSIIHTLKNQNVPRRCYSINVSSKGTSDRLKWDNATEIMSPYIKK